MTVERVFRPARYFAPIFLLLVSSMHAQTATATGSMAVARDFHTASILPNGNVLIVGGSSATPSGEAEVYSLTTNKFLTPVNTVGSLSGNAAAVMSNGQVLIAGGSFTPADSAQVYNPISGTFTATTQPLETPRKYPSATLLANGNVLIAGGQDVNGNDLLTAEIYSPLLGTFSYTATQMHADRYWHTATLMSGGTLNNEVVLAGGADGTTNARVGVDVYNPTTNSISFLFNMVTQRFGHTATQLLDGTLLITGGCINDNFDTTALAEIYNPATNTSTELTNSMTTKRCFHTATLLPDGTVLITGGISGLHSASINSSAEIYNPATQTFTAVGSMSGPRAAQTASLISYNTQTGAGQILVTGGGTTAQSESIPGTPTDTADLYSFTVEGGVVVPKYVVLGVVYAPPGSKSNVNYSTSEVLGTSSSLKSGFSNTFSIQAMYSFSTDPTGPFGSYTLGQSWQEEADSTSTYATNTTEGNGYIVDGPASSAVGVDHDYDEVIIWLNPMAALSEPASPANTVEWFGNKSNPLDTNQEIGPGIAGADIIWMPVYCLKNPYNSTCAKDYQPYTSRSWDVVANGGPGLGPLTQSDYSQILAVDPFAANPNYVPVTTTCETNQTCRFDDYLNYEVEYDTPPPGGQPTTSTGTYQYQTTSTQAANATSTYTTSISIMGGESFKDLVKEQITESDSFVWTNQVSASQTETSNSNATYSITGPATTDNYTGPSTFNVYRDVIYGSWMFWSPLQPTIPAASITFNPTSVSFADPVTVGGVSPATSVTVKNVSTVPMVMQNPAITFSDASFSVASGHDGCSGVTVPANGTCIVSVQFSPVGSEVPGTGLTTITGSMVAAGTETASGSENILITAYAAISGKGTQSTTTTTLTASPQTVVEGSNVILTATVTSSLGGTPSGSVQFTSSGVVLGNATLNGSGVGTVTISSAGYTPAVYPVIATYQGSTTLPASTSSAVNVTVIPSTTTTFTLSPNPVTRGQTLTATATVVASGGTAKPTGTVSFLWGSQVIATGTLSNGVATAQVSTSGFTAGSYPTTASYPGNSGFGASVSAPTTLVIQ